MNDKVIYGQLNQIESISTSHSVGQKQVLLNGNETDTNLTQVAYGILKPGEVVGAHLHNDMEECFFFIDGKGIYNINSIDYTINPGTFIKIPINTLHELSVQGDLPLCFIYWGIEKHFGN